MNPAPASPALLLCIDAQPVFLRTLPGADLVSRRCAFALAAATGLGLPVIFTEQVPAKLGGTDPALRALAPEAPVFAKDTFSALADPAIRAAVDAHPGARLLVCGLETPVCIYQTVRDARVAGRAVTVLADAVGARRPDDARTALDALGRADAAVLPAETVFYALLGSVRHPFFKAYTQLVKSHG